MTTKTRASDVDSRLYRLDVLQYLEMISSGIIPQGARVELLDGRLVDQMTKFAPHNYTSRQLGLVLGGMMAGPWIISEEKSVTLGRRWRPEPDIAVIRGPNARYRERDPGIGDIGLVIEVADSSYSIDRGEKWRAYAAARIPIYWIVHLDKSRIEAYRDPAGRGKNASYREAILFEADAEIPVLIDGSEVGRFAVKDVLP